MALKFFWWRSLKTRVTIFSLAIFLAGIWSLAFYVSQMLREDMQRLLGEQQLSTVSIVADQINSELFTRVRVLESSANTITPAIFGNAAAMQAHLDASPALRELFNAGIVAVGADGAAFASSPYVKEVIGLNLMDRDPIISALTEGKTSIGKPVMGKKLRFPIVGLAAPIRDPQGNVIGA